MERHNLNHSQFQQQLLQLVLKCVYCQDGTAPQQQMHITQQDTIMVK